MKQTNMRMLALCAALCLCVATAAPAYAESTRQTPRTSFVETLLDIPVLGDILRFFSGEETLSQAATAETATGETATPETSTPETATPTPAPTPGAAAPRPEPVDAGVRGRAGRDRAGGRAGARAREPA